MAKTFRFGRRIYEHRFLPAVSVEEGLVDAEVLRIPSRNWPKSANGRMVDEKMGETVDFHPQESDFLSTCLVCTQGELYERGLGETEDRNAWVGAKDDGQASTEELASLGSVGQGTGG